MDEEKKEELLDILLSFRDNEKQEIVGQLLYDKNNRIIKFEGNADESARMFFDYLSRYLKAFNSDFKIEGRDKDILGL